MKLFEVKQRLAYGLKEPLPGIQSQMQMMATSTSSLRFDLSKRATARHSGVLVLFYEDQGGAKIPLILRHDYNGAHSGQVSLPGGREELEDESIIDTALREAEEEIGVQRNEVEVIGQLTELYVPVSNHLVFPVIGSINRIPDFIPEPREVNKIIQVPVSDLLDSGKLKEKDLYVKEHKIRAPYFDLEGEVVWGATAMMLSELRQILMMD